jgi:hypothetical protein
MAGDEKRDQADEKKNYEKQDKDSDGFHYVSGAKIYRCGG